MYTPQNVYTTYHSQCIPPKMYTPHTIPNKGNSTAAHPQLLKSNSKCDDIMGSFCTKIRYKVMERAGPGRSWVRRANSRLLNRCDAIPSTNLNKE